MRSKIFIAILATAIGMSSCDWLTTKKQTTKVFNVEGNWQIDSINMGIGSSAKSDLHSLVFSGNAAKDSSAVEYAFTKDTVITKRTGEPSDTSVYKIDNNLISLKGTNDSANKVFGFTAINDSLISITHDDSSFIQLKRTR